MTNYFVFPTDVGMNRQQEKQALHTRCIPHGCGDEPAKRYPFSMNELVFPTDVGMNRKRT